MNSIEMERVIFTLKVAGKSINFKNVIELVGSPREAAQIVFIHRERIGEITSRIECEELSQIEDVEIFLHDSDL